jgi:Ca2+-binding EF-hand superfamily protein
MLREIDKNADDELSFEEFKNLLKKQEEKLREGEDELIDAFRGISII